MALIQCRECGREISSEAGQCPHCGAPLNKPTKKKCTECGYDIDFDATSCPHCALFAKMRRNIEKEETTKKQNKSLGCFALILLVTIVVFIANKFESKNTATTNPKYDWITDDASWDAYYNVCEHVKRQLKAPSTAEFPSFDKRFVVANFQTYRVTAYVDAENSFGAKLRTGFRGVIERKGQDTWRLESLEIDTVR